MPKLSTHSPHPCVSCSKIFSRRRNLIRHLGSVSRVDDKKPQCTGLKIPLPPSIISQISFFYQHDEAKLPDISSYVSELYCLACKRVFTRKRNLIKHLLDYTQAAPDTPKCPALHTPLNSATVDAVIQYLLTNIMQKPDLTPFLKDTDIIQLHSIPKSGQPLRNVDTDTLDYQIMAAHMLLLRTQNEVVLGDGNDNRAQISYKKRKKLKELLLEMEIDDIQSCFNDEEVQKHLGSSNIGTSFFCLKKLVHVVKDFLGCLPKSNHKLNPAKQIFFKFCLKHGIKKSTLVEWGGSRRILNKVESLDPGIFYTPRKCRKKKFGDTPFNDENIIDAATQITRSEASPIYSVCVGKDPKGEKICKATQWVDYNDQEFVTGIKKKMGELFAIPSDMKMPCHNYVMDVIRKAKVFKDSLPFDYHNCGKCHTMKYNFKQILKEIL